MPVDTKHPDYVDHQKEWKMMRDCARGESAVKAEGVEYLPMPSGFAVQDDGGRDMYAAYMKRAVFPDILAPTLSGMVGLIHHREAEIEGLEEGTPLAPLWERCTLDGLTLEEFHRRLTAEILLMGRVGALADYDESTDLPYFALYTAEAIINWAEDRTFFVLDESGWERDGFSWVQRNKWRVLELNDKIYRVRRFTTNLEDSAGEDITPTRRGGTELEEIPFVIAGPRDLRVRTEEPPLIGVGRSSLAVYRLDADYRHQLFHTGQETFVVSGINKDSAPKVLGSGVVLALEDPDSMAQYVGPSGTGIDAHRQAIIDERAAAVAAGARLFDGQKEAESGEALRIRAAAQTATLKTVAIASASALERVLRHAAVINGYDPEKIVVKPNLEFVDSKLSPSEAASLVSLWQSGTVSKQTVYENLQRGGIASEERTYDEEMELVEQDIADMPLPEGDGVPGGGAPSRFVDDGEGIVIERS